MSLLLFGEKSIIPGFSLKRATGISSIKTKIAKSTGIPTTKQGRKAKINRSISKALGINKIIK